MVVLVVGSLGGWYWVVVGSGGIKVEIKAISAQLTEVGVGLSWAELGNYCHEDCCEKFMFLTTASHALVNNF